MLVSLGEQTNTNCAENTRLVGFLFSSAKLQNGGVVGIFWLYLLLYTVYMYQITDLSQNMQSH